MTPATYGSEPRERGYHPMLRRWLCNSTKRLRMDVGRSRYGSAISRMLSREKCLSPSKEAQKMVDVDLF